MIFRFSSWCAIALMGVSIVLAAVPVSAQESSESVIIRTEGSLGDLVDLIESLGGAVTYQYEQLNALAAEVPAGAMSELRDAAGNLSIMKDALVAAPGPMSTLGERGGVSALGTLSSIPSDGASAISIGDLQQFANDHPGAYELNHHSDDVVSLHQQGVTGDGVIVAVFDTGLRPDFGNFETVDFSGIPSPIPGLDIGKCVDVFGFIFGDPRGCESAFNDGHGTLVASLIGDKTQYTFAPDSVFLNSVAENTNAALDLDQDDVPETVASIGSAPGAKIYMFKVFPDAFTPIPSSVLLDAVDLMLFLNNVFGLNIQVANLSLGSFTLHAGNSPMELLTDALLANGIVPVVSAGNTGPALLTTASPASSHGSIAVGGGSQVSQERITADINFCPEFIRPDNPFNCFTEDGPFPAGTGVLFRSYPFAQTAFFSARGPNADGRSVPDVMADGFAFGSGLGATTDNASMGIGTSFSAPTVAGIAALLIEEHPGASATQIRNAIVQSGDPTIIQDSSTEFDQGNGWVDAGAADALLNLGSVADTLPAPPHTTPVVATNLRQGTDLRIRSGNFTENVENLKPAQRVDILYNVLDSHKSFDITISEIEIFPAGCPQSPWFGEDEIRLAVHTAKTSAFPPAGFYFDLHPSPDEVHAFISESDLNGGPGAGKILGTCGNGECSVTIPDPEPGLARISVSGATENACEISAQVQVRRENDTGSKNSATGRISDDSSPSGFVPLTVNFPVGVEEVEFELGWQNDWSRYPTNDLDLGVFPPGCDPSGCAPLPILQTVDSPERFVLNDVTLGQIVGAPGPIPIPPGDWTLIVRGFAVNEPADQWQLKVTVDGNIVKIK